MPSKTSASIIHLGFDSLLGELCNLGNMRAFYQAFPNWNALRPNWSSKLQPRILHTLCAKLIPSKILSAVMTQLDGSGILSAVRTEFRDLGIVHALSGQYGNRSIFYAVGRKLPAIGSRQSIDQKTS